MSDFHFNDEDVELMLAGLETLKRSYDFPQYLNSKIDNLMLRIANGFPAYTVGEVRNICLGLEELLASNPMERKASDLLDRLRASLPSENRKKPL